LATRWKTGSQKDHRKSQATKKLAAVLGRSREVRKLCGKRSLQNQNSGPLHECNVGGPIERIAINIAGPFPDNAGESRYLVVATKYSEF
jgi:hypothetical protein